MPHITVFRANMDPPPEDLEFPAGQAVSATLLSGPFEIRFGVPVINQKPPAASIFMGERKRVFPQDSYLLIRQEIEPMGLRDELAEALLRVAEISGVFDIRYPGVLSAKLFEGVVNTPISSSLVLDGPLTLTAQPQRNPSEVATVVSADLAEVRALRGASRSRFQLASRWYRRGLDTLNLIDRFLSFWTALEVYPAEGALNVAAKTRDLLHSKVYPDLPPGVVKERTRIGRIEGLRGKIVHQGKAFVPQIEEEVFSDLLDRLGLIVRTCLCIAGNLKPDDALDKYVRERSEI